jgi:hypothetical protein
MMLIYVVNMLLMKANNHGSYLLNFFLSLLVFRIKLYFSNFTNLQKLVKKLLHEKYVKN